jgi:chemotaxis protein CheX
MPHLQAASSDPEQLAFMLDRATREVFTVMLGAELITPPSGVELRSPNVSAIVGMAGRLRGAVMLHCRMAAATAIASRMLMCDDPQTIADYRQDAVGEICNMIVGSFKGQLPDSDEQCMLSVPAVITGADYHLQTLVASTKVQLILEFEGEPICITLELRRDKNHDE